jgi:hypothetical protein
MHLEMKNLGTISKDLDSADHLAGRVKNGPAGKENGQFTAVTQMNGCLSSQAGPGGSGAFLQRTLTVTETGGKDFRTVMPQYITAPVPGYFFRCTVEFNDPAPAVHDKQSHGQALYHELI